MFIIKSVQGHINTGFEVESRTHYTHVVYSCEESIGDN
jgi:hypothetical protein